MNKIILVIAAHPDDEALGCGGTIVRHVAEGDTLHAVFMADGVSSRSNSTSEDLERRLGAAKRAHEILGLQRVEYLGLPDNRMDSLPMLEVVQALEAIIRAIKPQVIYTHYHGDLNVDHRVTHQAVMTACRPLPGGSVKEIYSFEVLSSTEWAAPQQEPFTPNMFVDISDFLEIKFKALQAYGHEMRPAPHARSMEHAKHLARLRGYSVGVAAAEGFVAIRQIR